MGDWVFEALHEQLRLDLEDLARKELGKLTKEELIEFLIDSTDLMRKREDCDE